MMYSIILALALIVVYFMFRIFKTPHSFIKSIMSIVFSMVTLTLLNVLGGKIGLFMPLNLASILTAGVLGIPGICSMIILNVVF